MNKKEAQKIKDKIAKGKAEAEALKATEIYKSLEAKTGAEVVVSDLVIKQVGNNAEVETVLSACKNAYITYRTEAKDNRDKEAKCFMVILDTLEVADKKGIKITQLEVCWALSVSPSWFSAMKNTIADKDRLKKYVNGDISITGQDNKNNLRTKKLAHCRKMLGEAKIPVTKENLEKYLVDNDIKGIDSKDIDKYLVNITPATLQELASKVKIAITKLHSKGQGNDSVKAKIIVDTLDTVAIELKFPELQFRLHDYTSSIKIAVDKSNKDEVTVTA